VIGVETDGYVDNECVGLVFRVNTGALMADLESRLGSGECKWAWPSHKWTAGHADPDKKKKRMDPALEKFKEERKIKRLTKALKKMQKKDRILKPVLEVEVPPHLVKEKVQRDRGTEVPYEIQEERILLGQ
jgi:Mitochondrial ribosomal protein L28.